MKYFYKAHILIAYVKTHSIPFAESNIDAPLPMAHVVISLADSTVLANLSKDKYKQHIMYEPQFNM